ARHALPRAGRLRLSVGPVAPGMTLERVRAQRRELADELLADGVAERGGDADVVQGPVVVVETEQERADHRAGAVLVPAKAGDDAVGGPRVLDLDHRALTRTIWRVQALGHHAVEPGALEAPEPVLGERAIPRRGRDVHRWLRVAEDVLEP